jgi:hypothetical protein
VRFVLAPRTLLARRRTTREGPRIELLPLAQSWADRPALCADGGAPKSFFQPLGFLGTDQKIGIGNPPVSVLDCPRPGQPPDPVPGHHSTPRLSAGSSRSNTYLVPGPNVIVDSIWRGRPGEGASLMRLHGWEHSVGPRGHINVKRGDGLRICLLCNNW